MHVDAAMMLVLWERGIGQMPWARGAALLEAGGDIGGVRTMGEQNARLLALHTRLFGPRMDLLSQCPECGVVAELDADADTLASELPPTDPAGHHQIDVGPVRVAFRLPAPADLTMIGGHDDPDVFAHRLLDRCVLGCTRDGEPVTTDELPLAVRDTLSQRMEVLDRGASLSFAVTCPQCAARWDAPLDVGQVVWQQVQSAAERLLLDVDALSRAYGWTEAEVLRLDPMRRAAYLQMVRA